MSSVVLCWIEVHPPGADRSVAVVAEWEKGEGYRMRSPGREPRHYRTPEGAILAAGRRAAMIYAEGQP
jgi:hypothetical protein